MICNHILKLGKLSKKNKIGPPQLLSVLKLFLDKGHSLSIPQAMASILKVPCVTVDYSGHLFSNCVVCSLFKSFPRVELIDTIFS